MKNIFVVILLRFFLQISTKSKKYQKKVEASIKIKYFKNDSVLTFSFEIREFGNVGFRLHWVLDSAMQILDSRRRWGDFCSRLLPR